MRPASTLANEILRMLRDPLFLFFTYVVPFLCFFGFARAFHMGTGAGVAYFAGSALTAGIVGNGLWGARTSDAGMIAGMAGAWLLYLPAPAALIAVAHLRYAMPLPHDWLSLIVMVTLGLCALRALGAIVVAVVESEGGVVIGILLLYAAQLFLSGATAPSTVMPTWVQNAGEFMPATYLVRAIQGILFRNHSVLDNLAPIGALLACTILGAALAGWIFQLPDDRPTGATAKLWVLAVLFPFVMLGGVRTYSKQHLAQNIGLYRNLKRSGTFLIRGARIFPGDGKVIENGSVLVRDGIIAEIFEGPGPNPDSLTAEVVEGAGKTLLPGLVDSQVRLSAPEGMAHSAAALLYNGITAARSAGDPLDESLLLRSEIADGDLLGAQIFVTGPLFAVLNDGESVRTPKTPEEARQQVKQFKSRGVDGVSAVLDAGWGEGMRSDRVDLLLVRSVAEEARAQKLPLVTRTGDARDVTDAVEVGSTCIEHGSWHDEPPDAVLARMVRQGTYFDPSLSVAERTAQSFRGLDRARSELMRAWKAGVPLVMGNDAGLLHEMQLWVQAGIPAQVALTAATTGGAKLLGAQNRFGSIRKGLDADLLMVDGNPLEDISAIGRISLVVFLGERIDRASLLAEQ